MNYFILLLIFILHRKKCPVLDGELRHHRTRPEHIPVHHDVVAEDTCDRIPQFFSRPFSIL